MNSQVAERARSHSYKRINTQRGRRDRARGARVRQIWKFFMSCCVASVVLYIISHNRINFTVKKQSADAAVAAAAEK